jgi:short-subunit dehydrogenase
MSFSSQVIVITGGSSGIGKQLAHDFLTRGAQVVIVSDDTAKLDRAYRELQAVSSGIEAVACDVRNQPQVQSMVNSVLSRYGHVDILINNAGYAVYRPFEESTVEEVTDILDVNLSGAMRCAHMFLPSMISRRSGRIVNVSSIGGEVIITPNAAYCAAKHGMVAWSKAIRYELAPFGISVNVVCPGHTKTNFHDHPSFRRRDRYRGKNSRSLAVESVSAAVFDAIERDSIVAYVPKRLSLVVWALNGFPFVTQRLWDRIAQRRVEQLYEEINSERRNSHGPE